MPRTPRGPIDELNGYTVLDLYGPTPPEDDYFPNGGDGQDWYGIVTLAGPITIWGVGLITFGPPTAAQRAFMANLANNSDLSTFPGDWVSCGFSNPVQQFPEIEIWPDGAWVSPFSVNELNQLERAGGVLITAQGVFGSDFWDIGGLTSATAGPDFYWSDIAVTNGTEASETLNGTDGPETLNGLGGDDTLNGGAGADALYGGAGNDHLIGGAGIDRLFGGDGNDRLEPGTEQIDQNFISMHPAADSLIDGGAGLDILVLDYTGTGSVILAADQLLASPGIVNVEAVDITGSAYSDSLSGSSAADVLRGGGGFDVLRGGGGDDFLDAGAPGASSVSAIHAGGTSAATAPSLDGLFTAGGGAPSVTLSLTEPPQVVTDGLGIQQRTANIWSFTVNEAGAQGFIDYTLAGTNGYVFGFIVTDENGIAVPTSYNPTVPIVFPHAGTYYLEVDAHNESSWASMTIDVTFSLEGANVLTSNMLYGGIGNDTYFVYSETDQVIENPGEGIDSVLSSVSYTLADNVEILTLTGTTAIDATGNGLGNVIMGNSAANVIIGGGGADWLTGAAGADVFKFTALSDSAPTAWDLITDFSGKHGGHAQNDKIDLSAIDANSNTPENDAFSLVSKFSGLPGQAYSSYDKQSGTTSIYLDVDGDRSADMVIQLLGHVNLTVADFIF